ncbi:hypothetical protein ABVT39_005476 [Epinephelus coioides]
MSGGAHRVELSSPQVLKLYTLRSSRISVRGDTEARRAQEECDVGPHFYLSSQMC